MVFCEMDSITEVISGHRIIIYYIAGKTKDSDAKETTLFKNTETALELLGKKNDDVLLIEIIQNTNQFRQFADLYKPSVIGSITLFAVNNEGIPLISEHIFEELNIFTAIERLAITCNLREIPKLGQYFNDTKEKEAIIVEHFKLFREDDQELSNSSQEELQLMEAVGLSKESCTRLHIRLPGGSKEELEFDNDTTLQEVWVTIGVKFNIKDFDLKTYNHSIYSEDDYLKSLKDLHLCPRGVLIVVNKTVINNNGRISSVIQRALYRLLNLHASVFQYVQGVLFVFWNYVFPSNNRITHRGQTGREIKSQSGNSNQSTSRRYAPRNVGSNIHTLRRNDDSDDENNRYNGNSTQQK